MVRPFEITGSAAAMPKNLPGGKPGGLAAELGQIITATVTKKTAEAASLATADGFRFDASADSIVGEVGDELRFEVVSAGKDSLKLKQIMPEAHIEARNSEARRSLSGIKTMLEKSGMYREHDGSEEAEERDLQLKAMEAASKIKRKLRYVTNNANTSALKELLASGVSLEKISIDILDSVMREIKAKPAAETPPRELDAMIDRYMAENSAPANGAGDKKLLAGTLAAQGLPPTERNMRSMNTMLIKLRDLGDQDNDSIAKLLKEEKPLTVENIYMARHTCARLPGADRLTDEKWLLLEAEAGRCFEREGIEKTPRNVDAAKLLVEREIPITAANIDKVRFLRGLGKNIDERKLLNQAAGRIKQDRPLADVSVYSEDLPAKYESVMADLPLITARHIDFLLRRGGSAEGLTVDGCCQSVRQAGGAAAAGAVSAAGAAFAAGETVSAGAGMGGSPPGHSGNGASAYSKVIEIRRKLTYEAVGRLIAKNIDITGMKLDEALAGLDSLAASAGEDYSSNLRAMNAGAAPENAAAMSELYSRVRDVAAPTNHVFAALLARSVPFTVRGVSDTVRADRLRGGYGQFETAASPRHGDSFAKIKGQIAPMLEASGIAATDGNVRAAGILIKNRLDVTRESVTEVRLIDMKLEALRDKLHPNIAALMIKERLNPLDMSVDDVLGYIDGFGGEYGESVGDKLAEHIRALDSAKALTPIERGEMISVYRALNAISKDGSVGLGLSLRHGHRLTLKNLMDDAKNFRRHGAAVSASAGGGRAEGAAAQAGESATPEAEDNIRRMLENVPRSVMNDCELNAMMIERLSERAAPGALRSIFAGGAQGRGLAEALELAEAGDNSPDFSDGEAPGGEMPEGRLERMRQGLEAAAEVSAERVARLEYAGAAVNVSNLQAMRLLETVGLGKLLDRLAGRISDEKGEDTEDGEDAPPDAGEAPEDALGIPGSDLAPLKNGAGADGVLADISDRIDALKTTAVSRALLDELELAQNALLVSRRLGRGQGGTVSLPVRLSEGVTELKMYVLDEAAAGGDTADLAVSLDAPGLGRVNVFARRSGSGVKLEVTADDPQSAAALRDNEGILRGHLAGAGFEEAEISFPGGAPEQPAEANGAWAKAPAGETGEATKPRAAAGGFEYTA